MIDLAPYRFEALIFDCDGTLADTAPLHFRAMAGALRDQGHEIGPDWYRARVGLSRDDLFCAFEKSFSVALDVAAARRKSRAIFRDLAGSAQPVTEVVAVARRHFGVVPMAVASGGEGDLVRATLTAIGALGCFDHVVTISDVADGKPAPALFLEAARRLGVAPGACLVFEDSDEGLEAARRASISALDVRLLLSGKPGAGKPGAGKPEAGKPGPAFHPRGA